MNLEQKVMAEMKDAMKSKNESALRTLRSIKAEIIKAKTEPGAGGEINEAAEMKILQRMMKQRKDSYEIFVEQKREDLSAKEKEEMDFISKFLPAQMNEADVTNEVKRIIAETGAASMADMGKVMGAATAAMSGKADAKLISSIVKNLLA